MPRRSRYALLLASAALSAAACGDETIVFLESTPPITFTVVDQVNFLPAKGTVITIGIPVTYQINIHYDIRTEDFVDPFVRLFAEGLYRDEDGNYFTPDCRVELGTFEPLVQSGTYQFNGTLTVPPDPDPMDPQCGAANVIHFSLLEGTGAGAGHSLFTEFELVP